MNYIENDVDRELAESRTASGCYMHGVHLIHPDTSLKQAS